MKLSRERWPADAIRLERLVTQKILRIRAAAYKWSPMLQAHWPSHSRSLEQAHPGSQHQHQDLLQASEVRPEECKGQ